MKANWIGALIVLTAIVGVGIGFGVVAERVVSDFDGQIALGCLTFLGGVWLAFWNVRKSREKEAESRIFTQKAAVYEDLVNILRDIFMEQRGWAPKKTQDQRAKALMVIRYKMIVWGGQETVRAINGLENVPDDSSDGPRFLAAANLYGAIRRDLGHSDDDAFAEDLFLTQITATDKEKVRGLIRAARAAKT